ncbi:HNH endonuclease [Rhodococcoides fascians]|uniref:HNH endonuclease n=1 Tax=Rhodococcoides fascians TaxID=1828 RepID=UPI00050BE40A|nr:hypothetical protein [Rhodococcus fascians]
MTTFPKQVDRARYKDGDALHNRILLSALWDVWGNRCYLNGCVKEAAEFQVEHILPHSLSRSEIEKTLAQYGNAEVKKPDFDVHAPHNLAPACARCNRDKNDDNYGGAGQLLKWLLQARRLEPKVRNRVAAYYRRDTVSKALQAMSIADLSDPAAKQSLLDLGPMVVARLRMVAPETLTGDSSYDYDDSGADESDHVLVTVDEGSRRARVILEEVYGGAFDDLLTEAVQAVRAAINARLKGDIVSQFEDNGHLDIYIEDVAGTSGIEIATIRFDAGLALFEVRGTFWGDGSASVAVNSPTNDSGTEWEQGDADDISGTFTCHVSAFNDGTVEATNDVELDLD